MKKTIYLLLVCLTGITFSCSEDDNGHQHTESETGAHFQKRTISFAEMKDKLSGKDVKSLALGIANKGGDDYIVSIDSTAVTEIINDSLTTYTLRVYTQDEENYAYSNLIIKELNGETEEYIIHYTPTPEWQAAYDSGSYADYQGEITITDTAGNDLGETGKSPCTFSIETVSVCTCEGKHTKPDPACTCTTFTNYYYLKITCVNNPSGGGNGPGDPDDPGDGDFGLPTMPHGGQQGGGGSGNYNYTAFNTEFIPLLTMPQINWLENHPDIFLQIYNYLQSYGEPTEYGWYDNYQAVEFAVEAVLVATNGGVINPDFYIETPTPDDNYVYTGEKDYIPNPIVLNNGESISVTFGTTQSDGQNANNLVSVDVINALKFALQEANANLPSDQKITSIYIKATTNGQHSPTSNHAKGTAVDISRINGVKMGDSGVTNQIIKLQQAFDNYQYIRENFGPHFKHKYSVETNTWNYNYSVSGHKDHIHISVRRP